MRTLAISLLVMGIFISNTALAGLLSSTSRDGGSGSRLVGVGEELRFRIGHNEPLCSGSLCLPQHDPASTWLDIVVDSSAVGSVFVADLSGFPLLFNGENDDTFSSVAYPADTGLVGGVGVSESFLVFGSGATAIDLTGFTMTSMAFTLDALKFESPGSDPNGDGIWTDYSYRYTLEFFGTTSGSAVPAPSTWLLLVSAAAALLVTRRGSWRNAGLLAIPNR